MRRCCVCGNHLVFTPVCELGAQRLDNSSGDVSCLRLLSLCPCIQGAPPVDTVPPVLRNFPPDVSVNCQPTGDGPFGVPPVPIVTAVDPNDVLFSPVATFSELQVRTAAAHSSFALEASASAAVVRGCLLNALSNIGLKLAALRCAARGHNIMRSTCGPGITGSTSCCGALCGLECAP
jgi:hypothetical protein